jgi:hypothetical protein
MYSVVFDVYPMHVRVIWGGVRTCTHAHTHAHVRAHAHAHAHARTRTSPHTHTHAHTHTHTHTRAHARARAHAHAHATAHARTRTLTHVRTPTRTCKHARASTPTPNLAVCLRCCHWFKPRGRCVWLHCPAVAAPACRSRALFPQSRGAWWICFARGWRYTRPLKSSLGT